MNEVELKRRFWFGYRKLQFGDSMRNRVHNVFSILAGVELEQQESGRGAGLFGDNHYVKYTPKSHNGLIVNRNDFTGEAGSWAPHNIPYFYTDGVFSIADGNRLLFDGIETEGSTGEKSYRVRRFSPENWESRLSGLNI